MDKNIRPGVTVLMPVYNGEKYLREAVESVLKQSYKNFEFLIINDGSTDESENITRSFKDKRIKIINNQVNLGLIASLNKGIRLARGKYIARMDADDISLPNRLELEYEFLENNPGYVMVGTNAEIMDQNGLVVGNQKMPLENVSIRKIMMVTNAFFHGSVMMRKDSVIKAGMYNKDAYVAEDYDLWSRMIDMGLVANLPESLYVYRLNPRGESFNKRQAQSISTAKIADNIWMKEGLLRDDWKLVWPETKTDLDAKQIRFYQYLHVQFAKKFRVRKKYRDSLQHILGAVNWVPLSLSPYFYLLMYFLPMGLFSKIEDYLIYNFFLKKNFEIKTGGN